MANTAGAGAARGNSNGLGVATEGREVPFEDLPPWNEDDIMVYPMVWTCPVTGQRSFQVHPVPVFKIHVKTAPDGPETTLTDLAEIRALLHRLQRPAISPQHVWAPAYSPGDLVIFYNRGKRVPLPFLRPAGCGSRADWHAASCRFAAVYHSASERHPLSRVLSSEAHR